MELLTEKIKKQIKDRVVRNARLKKDHLLGKHISAAVDSIHAGIPDNKRVSYGIFHSITVCGRELYQQLTQAELDVLAVARSILAQEAYPNARGVALGLLSLYGVHQPRRVFPLFKKSAASADWVEREFAQGLFRPVIKAHPQQAQKFLLQLVKSKDPNQRRFVSETLRPVRENRWFYKTPDYPLTVLENLFAEAEAYPRTSVGNNLSDLSRRLPDLVLEMVKQLTKRKDKNSDWIAHRACRNLIKTHPQQVLALLRTDEYRYKGKTYRR